MVECFAKAVAVDPNYALAWSSLADAYHMVGFYGLDVYSLWDSMRAVMEYLDWDRLDKTFYLLDSFVGRTDMGQTWIEALPPPDPNDRAPRPARAPPAQACEQQQHRCMRMTLPGLDNGILT